MLPKNSEEIMETSALENDTPILPPGSDMESLCSKLLYYQQEAKRLAQLNLLHQQLALILDLPSMIKTYSLWLMESVDHDLIGYNNPIPQRIHMYCSYHGAKRRDAIHLAQKTLEEDINKDITGLQSDGFYVYRWAIHWDLGSGLLILLRKDKGFSLDEQQIINESLAVLAGSFYRAMQYETVSTGAQRDYLTALATRSSFEERIPTYIDQAKRYNRPLTLLSLHLDEFKEVNENMGRMTGDNILREVATVLQKESRLSDFLVRMGGDQFLAVLPNTDQEQGRVLATRLSREMSKLTLKNKVGGTGDMTVSIGLSPWSQDVGMQEWIDSHDKVACKARISIRN